MKYFSTFLEQNGERLTMHISEPAWPTDFYIE